MIILRGHIIHLLFFVVDDIFDLFSLLVTLLVGGEEVIKKSEC